MPAKTPQMNVSDNDEGSEIIEDRAGAYSVLAHADGRASVVIEMGVTAGDVARAFALVPQALVLSTTGLGTGEGQGDRYFHYVTA